MLYFDLYFLMENRRMLRTHDDTVTLPWTEQNSARSCGRTRFARLALPCPGPRVRRSWRQRCELQRMAGFLGDGEVVGVRGMLTEAFQGQRSVGSGYLPEQGLHGKGS